MTTRAQRAKLASIQAWLDGPDAKPAGTRPKRASAPVKRRAVKVKLGELLVDSERKFRHLVAEGHNPKAAARAAKSSALAGILRADVAREVKSKPRNGWRKAVGIVELLRKASEMHGGDLGAFLAAEVAANAEGYGGDYEGVDGLRVSWSDSVGGEYLFEVTPGNAGSDPIVIRKPLKLSTIYNLWPGKEPKPRKRKK